MDRGYLILRAYDIIITNIANTFYYIFIINNFSENTGKPVSFHLLICYNE